LNIAQVVLFGPQAKGAAKEEGLSGEDNFQRAELTKENEIDAITLTPEELNDESSLLAHFVRNGLPVRAAQIGGKSPINSFRPYV